jgi:hypothetical protein
MAPCIILMLFAVSHAARIKTLKFRFLKFVNYFHITVALHVSTDSHHQVV